MSNCYESIHSGTFTILSTAFKDLHFGNQSKNKPKHLKIEETIFGCFGLYLRARLVITLVSNQVGKGLPDLFSDNLI